jgi:hypothetical protein
MKYSKIILGTTLLSIMALGTPAFADGSDKHEESNMSMMDSGQAGSVMGSEQQGQMGIGASQGNMSNPMMQMMMMQMMQMMMQQHGNKMSMHGGQGGHQGGMGMMSGKQGGMGMMGGSKGNMSNMMQEKQAEMKQHMQTMETKLGNIEALLQELVDLQKNG